MEPQASNRPHIVLIEDNASDVYLIRLALEQSGIDCELTNFQSGADAVRSLFPTASDAQAPRKIDLILLDLNTPCCDGFEVLARIRAEDALRKVPVAIVTSSVSRTDKERAASIGATAYLEKPTSLSEFLDNIGQGVKKLLSTGRTLAAG